MPPVPPADPCTTVQQPAFSCKELASWKQHTSINLHRAEVEKQA